MYCIERVAIVYVAVMIGVLTSKCDLIVYISSLYVCQHIIAFLLVNQAPPSPEYKFEEDSDGFEIIDYA